LQGIGHQQGSVADAGASNLDAVAYLREKTLIVKESRRA
jgi:hypothetical protein